jgi:hypothetical protein
MSISPVLSSISTAPNVAWSNSWVTINNDQNRPLFAQATYVTNPSDITSGGFTIPPYKFTALTNDVDGNPTYIEFKDTGPSGTVVAALSCTYVNKFVTSVFQVI